MGAECPGTRVRTVAWGGEAVQAPPTAQCFVITVLTWTQRLGWPLTNRNSCGSCGEQEMSEVVKVRRWHPTRSLQPHLHSQWRSSGALVAQVAGRDSGLVSASTVLPSPADSKAHPAAIPLGTVPAAWLRARGSCVHRDLQWRARVTNRPPSHTPCLRRLATFPEGAEFDPLRVWFQRPHLGKKRDSLLGQLEWVSHP